MSPDYKFPSKEMTEFQLVTEVWATANRHISLWRSAAVIGWILLLMTAFHAYVLPILI